MLVVGCWYIHTYKIKYIYSYTLKIIYVNANTIMYTISLICFFIYYLLKILLKRNCHREVQKNYMNFVFLFFNWNTLYLINDLFILISKINSLLKFRVVDFKIQNFKI